MPHVNYIACDGCGEKIGTENMIYIHIVDQSPINEHTKNFIPLFPIPAGSPMVNRKEVQYYFHNKECMHVALANYIESEGMKITK